MFKYVGLIAAVVLALVAMFVFKISPAESFKLVTDKEAASVFCADLLSGNVKSGDQVSIPVEVTPTEAPPEEPLTDVPAPPAP